MSFIIKNKKFLLIVAVAMVIKLFLFAFAEARAPEAKYQFDSDRYIKSGVNLVTRGQFVYRFTPNWVDYEYYRMPGYPLFLGLLHVGLKLPFSAIVFIQLFLTVLAAYCVYRTSLLINPKLAFLSGVVILYDPTVTIFSLMLLTEPLYLLLMALFAWSFVKYLRDRTVLPFLGAVVCLSASIFVRPIGVHLIIPIIGFVLLEGFFQKHFVKSICLGLAAFLILSIPIELWKERNENVYGHRVISSIGGATIDQFGLYRHYSRNDDPAVRERHPAVHYTVVTLQSFSNLLLDPGSLKNFDSDSLKAAGKLFGYPWGVVWIAGFCAGLIVMPKNRYYGFLVLLSAYFILGTVWAVTTMATPRFRVPVMPFAAIITAYGWCWLWNFVRRDRL